MRPYRACAQRACAMLLLSGLTVAAGCAEEESDPASGLGGHDVPVAQQVPAAGDWCAVKQILDRSCTECHDGRGAAGTTIGLTSFADLTATDGFSPSRKVYQTVADRVHDVAKPMPPSGMLSADALKVIDDWVAAGAPEGSNATCGATPGTPGLADATSWPPAECDEVYELRVHGSGGLDTPFVVSTSGETHPQFNVVPPWGSTKVQAIAFKPIVDNAKVLHHCIVYAGMTMLTGWVPGDHATEPYPKDVGMDLPNTNALRLDLHYLNRRSTTRELDRSGVSVCVVKGEHLRPQSAGVTMSFTAFGPILAPANTRDHASIGVCRVNATTPVTILDAHPYAHNYAKRMRFVVKKENGQEVVMHDQPFKFGAQGIYPLNPPVVVQSRDVVTTTCIYDNPTARNITFGESSENEQCFNFATYYPRGALSCGGVF